MVEKNKKKQELEINVFEKELSKMPPEVSKILKKQESKVKPLIDEIKKQVKEKSAGFYLMPELEVKNNVPTPNFEKLTLFFMLDDFDRPIVDFNPEILLQNKFKDLLEKTTNETPQGIEVFYNLKSDKNIKFRGTSITMVREECFDNVHDSMKELSNSIVYEDPRNFLMALKTIEIHKSMVLRKFEKYVVVNAGVGSWVRGEKSNDFDIFFVIDDTDVKKMPRYQVKDQLTRIIYEMAMQVASLTGIKLHIQTYLLTDFWDNLKDASPVIFTFLRDGVPFYDRGLFSSWKELLKLGKVKPSPEAIDMHMNIGEQLLKNAKHKLKDILMGDIYNAVLSPSQAILMLKGFNPTTPKETVKLFKEVLLEKEKIITKKELDTLEKARSMFKELEHDEKKEISGKEIDSLLKDSEKYLEKMKEIFKDISNEKIKTSMLNMYNQIIDNFKELDIIVTSNLYKNVEKFVKDNKLSKSILDSLKQVIKAKEDNDKGKATVSEVNKSIKEGRSLLFELRRIQEDKILKTEKDKKFFIKSEEKIYELVKSKGSIYLRTDDKNYKLKKSKFETTEDKIEDIESMQSLALSNNLYKALNDLFKDKEFSILK